MNEGKMIQSLVLSALAVAAALGPISAPARGELIRFTFGGEVTTLHGTPPGPWSGVAIGSPFEFSYVFDSETPDILLGPEEALYDVEELTVTLADAPQTTTVGEIYITNDYLWWDTYEVNAYDLPIGGGGGVSLYGFDALESDELPTTLDLEAFDAGRFFEIGTGTSDWFVYGSVATFESEVVPAPGVLALFVTGGLLGRRRRRCGR